MLCHPSAVIQKEKRRRKKKKTYSEFLTWGKQRTRKKKGRNLLDIRTTFCENRCDTAPHLFLRSVVAMENIDRAKSQVMISFADQSKRESVSRRLAICFFHVAEFGGYRFVVFTFSVFTFLPVALVCRRRL